MSGFVEELGEFSATRAHPLLTFAELGDVRRADPSVGAAGKSPAGEDVIVDEPVDVVRGSGAAASGGTSIPASLRKRSSAGPPQMDLAEGGDMRIATTGALTVTGITFEAVPVGVLAGDAQHGGGFRRSDLAVGGNDDERVWLLSGDSPGAFVV